MFCAIVSAQIRSAETCSALGLFNLIRYGRPRTDPVCLGQGENVSYQNPLTLRRTQRDILRSSGIDGDSSNKFVCPAGSSIGTQRDRLVIDPVVKIPISFEHGAPEDLVDVISLVSTKHEFSP
jgi:hypothetical protein